LDIGRGYREGRVKAICEAPAGTVWLYTADGQLCRYRDGKVDMRQNMGPSYCRTMAVEKPGKIWVGTDRMLFCLDVQANLGADVLPIVQTVTVDRLDLLLTSEHGGYWRFANGQIQKCEGTQVVRDLGPYPWRQQVEAYCACEDLDGNLIVGTKGDGVWWYDAAGMPTHLSGDRELTHNYILSLRVDHEGTLWVGTDGGGLDRVKRQVFRVVDNTSHYVIESVSEDAEHGVWFNGHGGVLYLKDGVLKEFGKAQGLVSLDGRTTTDGRAVFVDHSNQVWASTVVGGLFQLHDGEFQHVPTAGAINSDVYVIYQDRKGLIWVGMQGGLASWDGTNWTVVPRGEISPGGVHAIAEDSEGNLWIGREGGLDRLRDGHFTRFGKKDGLPSENISALLADADGGLWVGTFSSGLVRYFNGKWTRYSTAEGLASNNINYLLEDGDGNLWIGSNVGLMRMPLRALRDFVATEGNLLVCRVYATQDGLDTSECTSRSQPGACRTHDGQLWFPTIKGVAVVDPAQIKPNTNQPPVLIEGLSVDQRRITNSLFSGAPASVTISPGQERLDIQFTSLNLSAADKARFRYRMEGHETRWTEVDSGTRSAHYTKLPPGNYTFHVIACNEDGIWNDTGASLKIIVQPPFWRTWTFIIVATLCVVGIIVGSVHYFSTQRLQRQLALEKERRRIARDIHDQVGASLTQVSMLGEMVESDKESPEEVEEHGRQISQTARDTAKALDEIVWAVNPSNDTLDGLITYFCKYAQEYLAVAGLRYRLDVPSQLPATQIAPDVRHNVFLAAKEAVTNIVRHAGATSAWIRLRLELTQFVLEIEDNGKGMAGMDEKHAATRNGLSNMRKRLEESGGSCTFNPGTEGGTLVRLTVPLGKGRV
jgi:ligand-binding sensor domain-containing protein/two-component sensor histidine kinase